MLYLPVCATKSKLKVAPLRKFFLIQTVFRWPGLQLITPVGIGLKQNYCCASVISRALRVVVGRNLSMLPTQAHDEIQPKTVVAFCSSPSCWIYGYLEGWRTRQCRWRRHLASVSFHSSSGYDSCVLQAPAGRGRRQIQTDWPLSATHKENAVSAEAGRGCRRYARRTTPVF